MSSEETHHKMSKKIAQLTKVIFHLHSKSEENALLATAQTNAYEREIEQLLVAANAVLVRQKDALAVAEAGTSWKEKIGRLEAAHLEERAQSQAAFQGYQAILEQKEQALQAEHAARLREMKDQVGELRKNFDGRC